MRAGVVNSVCSKDNGLDVGEILVRLPAAKRDFSLRPSVGPNGCRWYLSRLRRPGLTANLVPRLRTNYAYAPSYAFMASCNNAGGFIITSRLVYRLAEPLK